MIIGETETNLKIILFQLDQEVLGISGIISAVLETQDNNYGSQLWLSKVFVWPASSQTLLGL